MRKHAPDKCIHARSPKNCMPKTRVSVPEASSALPFEVWFRDAAINDMDGQ